MKKLILYHGSCMDGFTAAWLYWRRYGDADIARQYGGGGHRNAAGFTVDELLK